MMLQEISCRRPLKESGFTLIELMIAMAVGAIIMAAVMTSFLSQHRSYLAQDDAVEMQQNARVSMDILTRDIRSIGYDPNNIGTGITAAANATNLVFTRDDGTGALETIRYTLVDAFTTDSRNDGVVDDLGRSEGAGGLQPVAENISNIEFRYLDEDGTATATPDDIRSIQVSLLAVASRPDPNFTNTMTYTPASNVPWDLNGAADGTAPNDHFRRRLLITTVNCRNLGL